MMPTCIKMEWQLTISPLDPSISKSPGDLSFENTEGEATNCFFFPNRVVFFFVFFLKKTENLSVGWKKS